MRKHLQAVIDADVNRTKYQEAYLIFYFKKLANK